MSAYKFGRFLAAVICAALAGLIVAAIVRAVVWVVTGA